jgi:hypothetical protein
LAWAAPSRAVENSRRGWPPFLRAHDGELRNYLVIRRMDAPQPELRRRADELAERGWRKRLGRAAEAAPGQAVA